MKLRILLSIASIYMAVAGSALSLRHKPPAFAQVPPDASAALIAYLRLFGTPS